MSDQTEQLTSEFTKRLQGMKLSPEREAEFTKRDAESSARADAQHTQELRSKWNAPRRHVLAKPTMTGEWLEHYAKLKDKLEPSTGRLLALVGGRGNGKTQMAVEFMKIRTTAQKSAVFVSAVEFFIRIKATYSKESDQTEMEVIREFQKPSLLVIDEIGKRGGSEWENTMLFELLNRRYNDMTDTILIDNRSKIEFADTIGPSLASRMNEGGGIIECTWPSFRT